MPTIKEEFKNNKSEKRYVISGYLGIDPNTGIAKYTTLHGFTSQRAATEAFDDAKYDLRHGKIEVKAVKIRVHDAYDQWLESYSHSVKPVTAYNRRKQWKHNLKDQFGDYLVDRLTTMDIQKWLNKFSRTHSGYRTAVTTLSLVLRYSVRMGWIQRNPCEYLEYPRDAESLHPHAENNRFTLEEAQNFIDVLDKKAEKNQPLGFVVVLACVSLSQLGYVVKNLWASNGAILTLTIIGCEWYAVSKILIKVPTLAIPKPLVVLAHSI